MSDVETPPPAETPTEAPAPRPRWGRRILLGLLALPLLLVLGLLGLLRTDAGLELVRRVAVGAANDALRGQVGLERISGDALSTLRIEGLEVRTATGADVLGLDRLTLEWRPGALLSGEVRVPRIALEGLRARVVQTSTDSWNVLDILPPPSPDPAPPSDEPLDLPRIVLGALTLDEGTVDVRPRDGSPLAARALRLDVGVEAEGDRVQVSLRNLSARGLPFVDAVALETRADLAGDTLTVRDLRLDAGDGRVTVPRLETRLPPGPLEGDISVSAPRALLVAVGAPPDWRPDVSLDLRVARAADTPKWQASGGGVLGDIPWTIAATATEDLGTLALAFDASKVDPRAVLPGLPSAALGLRVRAEGDLANFLAPRVDAQVSLRGRIQPPGQPWVTIAPLALDATWTGDEARLSATGRVGDARLDVNGAVRGLADRPVVAPTEVRLDAPDLGALLGAPAAGHATLTATVAGPLDGLQARGRLSGEGVAYGSAVALRRLAAEWSMDRVWPAPRGEAAIRVDGVRADGRRVDRLRLEVRAQGEDAATRIDVPRFAITTGDVEWRGGGATTRLYPEGRVDVRGLGLRSEAGRLAVDGTYDPAEASRATLSLVDVDLSRVPRTLVPELDTARGVIDVDAQASLSGRTVRATVATQARGLGLAPDRPGVDIRTEVALEPKALTVTATVGDDDLGRVRLTAVSAPPRDMLAPEGWARLASRPVEEARVELERLNLGRLQQVAGDAPLLTGGLSGTARLEGSGARARVALHTVDLDIRSVAQPFLQVGARFDPGTAGVDVRLQGDSVGRATLTATVAAPTNLFDAKGWATIDESAVRDADVDLTELDLGLLDLLGVAPGVAGRVSADVALGPVPDETGEVLTLAAELNARKVQIPALHRPLDAGARLRIDGRRLRLTSRVEAEGTPLVTLDARAPLPLRRLLYGDPETLPETPLQADVEVDALPLALLAQVGGLAPNLVDGTLTASITARGTAQAPRARARITTEGLDLAGVRFDVGAITATVADGVAQAGVRLSGPDAGRLTVSARTPLPEPDLEARVLAAGFDLQFLSRLGLVPVGLEARLFADVRASGRPEAVRPSGWAELRDMSVVFEQAVLHPLTEGRARVDIEPEIIRLDFGAAAGEGRVGATATVRRPPDAPIAVEAKADLKRYPVSAGTLVRVDMQADVAGTSGPDGTQLAVTLHDGFVEVPDEKTESLHPISTPDDVVYVDRLPGGRRDVAGTSTVAAGPPTIVEVRTSEPITIRGGPVVARLATEVEAKTSPRGAALGGRAFTTDGTIELFRRRYDIVKAQLAFQGESPPDPRVDVRLRHTFPTLELSLHISGTANEPELFFIGRPARFSQAELLTIFLGTDPEELGQTSDQTLEQQAQGAIAGLLVGQLQNQIGRVLPIDTLDVELGPDAGVSGARVTLGKWITRQIFVAYRYRFDANPEQENANEAVVQYRFLPGWMAEAVLGLTRNDLDVFWTKRF